MNTTLETVSVSAGRHSETMDTVEHTDVSTKGTGKGGLGITRYGGGGNLLMELVRPTGDEGQGKGHHSNTRQG